MEAALLGGHYLGLISTPTARRLGQARQGQAPMLLLPAVVANCYSLRGVIAGPKEEETFENVALHSDGHFDRWQSSLLLPLLCHQRSPVGREANLGFKGYHKHDVHC